MTVKTMSKRSKATAAQPNARGKPEPIENNSSEDESHRRQVDRRHDPAKGLVSHLMHGGVLRCGQSGKAMIAYQPRT
jgi:hypothetical protein